MIQQFIFQFIIQQNLLSENGNELITIEIEKINSQY